MSATANRTVWSASHWKLPVVTLVVVTLALNVLGLSIPIAATQIFDRIIASPGSPTLAMLSLGVLGFAFLEMLLRLARAYMIAQAGASYGAMMTCRVLAKVATSDIDQRPMRSAGSLEYLGAVQQTKEKYNGQVLVGIVELLFLPVILSLIFYISPPAGLITLVLLLIFSAVFYRGSTALRHAVNANSRSSEDRYDFLFVMLSSMHGIKTLAIEEHILRRYEKLQARLAAGNNRAARLVGQMLNSAPIANQVIVAAMLAQGAFAVTSGQSTLGAVSALVLLGGRVMGPLQRAIFIIVQLRDVSSAQDRIDDITTRHCSARPRADLSVANEGRVSVQNLDYRPARAAGAQQAGDGEGKDGATAEPAAEIRGANLEIHPGEFVTIAGPVEPLNTALMHLLAGIRAPTTGTVRINGEPPQSYPQALLNRCVGYVPPNGVMFRGTIRNNITRFGEVTVEEAMSVAAMLGVDGAINRLPQGLDTELLGSASETIPPGLRQQLSIVRALAARPRLILFDRVDQGLDRNAYAGFHRLIGKLHGQATIIAVTEDSNLIDRAGRHFLLDRNGRLAPALGAVRSARVAYRDLTL